jgi:putative oxidoreductase
VTGLRRRARSTVAACDRWLMRHSIMLLRASLGVVFLLFGALKLVPGLSPAAPVAIETTELLTFGLVPAGTALAAVAVLECTIGALLLTGRLLGVGIALLGMALVGILSPLVLLHGELFTGPWGAPNLLGQYVIKDLILAAATLVVLASIRGGRLERRSRRPPCGSATELATPA